MKTVKLHDKNFDVYINEQQIKLRVEQLATEIFRKPFAPYFPSGLADYFWVSDIFELL